MKPINWVLKFLAIFGSLSTMASTENFDCTRCKTQDHEYLKSKLFIFSREEQLKHLHTILTTENTQDPLIFAKIRTLMCSISNFHNNNRIKSFSRFADFYQNDYKEAYDILKIAIKQDKKNIVKLLYNYVPFTKINLVKQCKYTYSATKCSILEEFPTDFEILAQAAKEHADPIGMAQVLQNVRDPRDVPFNGKIPVECKKTPQDNPKFNNFCKYIEDAIANHQTILQNKFQQALEEEARKK